LLVVEKRQFATRQEVELCIFDYIEIFCIQQRLYSSIDYMMPVQFENQLYNQQKLTLRTVN